MGKRITVEGDPFEQLLDKLLPIGTAYGRMFETWSVEDQQHFIAGFKHTEGFKDAKQALLAAHRATVAAARIEEAQLPMFRYGVRYGMPKELADEMTKYCRLRMAALNFPEPTV
jgi:hypothetical protein